MNWETTLGWLYGMDPFCSFGGSLLPRQFSALLGSRNFFDILLTCRWLRGVRWLWRPFEAVLTGGSCHFCRGRVWLRFFLLNFWTLIFGRISFWRGHGTRSNNDLALIGDLGSLGSGDSLGMLFAWTGIFEAYLLALNLRI